MVEQHIEPLHADYVCYVYQNMFLVYTSRLIVQTAY